MDAVDDTETDFAVDFDDTADELGVRELAERVGAGDDVSAG